MQRRKFIAGLGALAGGASVAMGTGALSATEADRHLTGQVADDSDAYVSMYGTWDNGHYVNEEGTEISLDFGEQDGADGLNANATNWFDSVFHVGIESPAGSADVDDYEFWISLSDGVVNSDRIDFYRGVQRNNSIVGEDNRVSPWSGSDGERISVGVEIDLRGTSLGAEDSLAELFGVTGGDDFFTVHVDNSV